jgi:hypothetical protein
MKTQVIQLELHDDVASLRDKMSWAKTERILLVTPSRSRLLSRKLDLLVIQRHAVALGAQLGIVARSKDKRRLIESLGIPAFRTVGSAQRQPWETKKEPPARPLRRHDQPDLEQMRREAFPPEAQWRSLFWARFSIFTLAVLAILAIFSLFIPSATISISPEVRLQSLTFPVSASLTVSNVNLAGSLPARLTTLVVEHSKTIATTGSVAIPDATAEGTARFRNLTTAQTDIPAGTEISTQTDPPVSFATKEAAVVPAGFNKTVDVPIQAVEAGSSGNLPAGELVAIESELGTSLAVTNPDPTTGGSDHTGAIQTARDRSRLHDALLAEIMEGCKTGLQQALAPADIVFPDTLEVIQVLSNTYFPSEDQGSETLSLTMRVQCQEQYASQTDLNSLAVMSLDANLQEGFAPYSTGLVTEPASTPLTDKDGVTHWDLQVQRLVHARLDPLKIQQLAMGHRPATAILRLKASLLLDGTPTIQIKPDWWPWVPLIPFRITVSTGG